jgi:hypothetical protein
MIGGGNAVKTLSGDTGDKPLGQGWFWQRPKAPLAATRSKPHLGGTLAFWHAPLGRPVSASCLSKLGQALSMK